METISYNPHPVMPLRDVHGWDDLARLATEAGSHWFDADTRRFFGSRLLGAPMLAHRNEDRTEVTYVGVTSEYDGFNREGRDYSVRVFSFRSDQTIRVSDGRTLDVVDLTIDAEEADGERLRHRTAKAAHAAARRHVEAIRAAVWLAAVESVTA